MTRRGLQIVVVLVLWGLITHGTHAGTGDEPHYLAAAHSIAFDGDLDLANNYGANEPLVGGGVLKPDTHVRTGVDGSARPVHDVGLPLMLAPYVRVAVPLTLWLTRVTPESLMRRARLNPPVLYRHLVSFAMIALAALLAGALFDAFVTLGATPTSAAGTAALLVLSPPLLIFSVLIFTEGTSALLCFLVFAAILLKDTRGTSHWWWLGCAAGFLFLLHAKNVGLTLPLTILALLKLRSPDRRREAMAFVSGVTVLVVVRVGVNLHFWGSPISGPHARLGAWPGLGSTLHETWTRTLGLLVDQEFGLLIYAPIYIAALAGLIAWRNARRELTLAIVAVVGVYVTLIVCPLTNVHGWMGGWNPAGRFLTPVLPLVGLLVFAGLRATPRWLAATLVIVQVGISAYAWQNPKILWNDGDGQAAMCDTPCAYLPSFSSGPGVKGP
jgi:hypothetical protein